VVLIGVRRRDEVDATDLGEEVAYLDFLAMMVAAG